MKLTSKDLINTYIENDNGKLLKLYMETCASVGLHVFHDGDEAFDAEFYRDGLFIACTEHSVPSSEGVLQLLMTEDDLGYELTWEELAKMNIDNLATQTPEEKEALDLIDTTTHQYEASKFSGEPEWKNGDEVVISSKSKSQWFVVGVSPVRETSTVCVSNTGELKSFHTNQLTKPETPQQREERERLEAAIELHDLAQGAYFACDGGRDGSATWDKSPERVKSMYFAIVDKTNYRKESN